MLKQYFKQNNAILQLEYNNGGGELQSFRNSVYILLIRRIKLRYTIVEELCVNNASLGLYEHKKKNWLTYITYVSSINWFTTSTSDTYCLYISIK